VLLVGKAETSRWLSKPRVTAPRRKDRAQTLAAEGIEVEIVDVLALVPLDVPTVLRSVRKTDRLVTLESQAAIVLRDGMSSQKPSA